MLNSPQILVPIVFVIGTVLGALANWAIYRLAWNPREIPPWGPVPKNAKPRAATDRVPVIGWLGLARESHIHGRGFWLRPMFLELLMGVGLAALCWWEVYNRALVEPQIEELLARAGIELQVKPNLIPPEAVWWTFVGHVVLIPLMVIASFIDIDEKIIPDELTVPGTIVGLILATCIPQSLLPVVTEQQSDLGIAVPLARGVQVFVEPATLAAPNPFPSQLLGAPNLWSLALGLACWWLWCFALTPRIWRGRRSAWKKLTVIMRRVIRELTRPPLAVCAGVGTLFIACVWFFDETAWVGLLTALVGMASSGGLIWIVRLVGSAALKKEAMGFGDVTLMMMVGTFLGWPMCVVVFFFSPFAAVVVGLVLLITKQDDVIPYGPFLCMAAVVVIVFWAPIWNRVDFAFQIGWLMPTVLVVCFVLLGVILFIWQQIKMRLLGWGGTHE